MIKGKTASGFEFEVPEGLKKDVKLLRAVRDFYKAEKEGNQEMLLDKALDLPIAVLGNSENEERLYKHLESVHGRALIDDLMAELTEIVNVAAEEEKAIKNS